MPCTVGNSVNQFNWQTIFEADCHEHHRRVLVKTLAKVVIFVLRLPVLKLAKCEWGFNHDSLLGGQEA